jgi:hypothetical protein
MSRIVVFMGCAVNSDGDLLGVKRVGKDTCATIVETACKSRFNAVYSPLAGALKEHIHKYYNLDMTPEDLERYKETALPVLSGKTPRYIYEQFGTNVVRKGWNMPNIWVEQAIYRIRRRELSPVARLVADLFDLNFYELFENNTDGVITRLGKSRNQLENEMKQLMGSLPHPTATLPNLHIVTDCRFPNEYHTIREELKFLQPTFVRVKRTFPDEHPPEILHPSNQMYPEMCPDFEIENNGSFEDLHDACTPLIRHLTSQ